MRDEFLTSFDDEDDFEKEANRSIRVMAGANIAGLVTGVVVALGVGYLAWAATVASLGVWALAAAGGAGLVAGYVTMTIIALTVVAALGVL